jgi:hypothetical protein
MGWVAPRSSPTLFCWPRDNPSRHVRSRSRKAVGEADNRRKVSGSWPGMAREVIIAA